MRLNNADIDKSVEEIREFFQKAEVSHRDILKISLIIEESLLRWQDHFGTEHEFKIYFRKWFSAPKITIRLKDKPFNPLKNDFEAEEEPYFSNKVLKNLMHYDAMGANYRYENGNNELIVFSTKERSNFEIPGGPITISIILAIILSFLDDFLPQNVQDALLNSVANPILDTLMQLIVTTTIFMVFFAIISGICAMEDSTTLGNIGVKVIRRIFLLNFVIIVISLAVSVAFFPVNFVFTDNSLAASKIMELLLSIIPTNIVNAFLSENILQVTVLAFLVGICIITIGNHIPNLKILVIELNNLVFEVTEVVLKVIPVTIFLCIFKTMSESDLSEFFVVWKIILANIAAYFVIMLLILLYVKLKTGVNLVDFIKKVFLAFIIGFTTVNGSATLPKIIEISRDKLHIDGNFCNFWAPLALVLFSPSELIALTLCVIYGMSSAGVALSIIDTILIIFLVMQLIIATPDSAGGIAATFGIILAHFGLSLEIIGELMIAEVVIENIFMGLDVIAHECELLAVSDKLGLRKSD